MGNMIKYTCKLVKGTVHEVLCLSKGITKLVIVGDANDPTKRTEDILFRGISGNEANNIQGQEVVFSEIREIFVGSRVACLSNITQELEVKSLGSVMKSYRVNGISLDEAFAKYAGENLR
jgi:hypothetical protein